MTDTGTRLNTMALKAFQDGEEIERSARAMADIIPHLDWLGKTRMHIAAYFKVPTFLLEKAMSINENLNFLVLLIEQEALIEGLEELRFMQLDKKANPMLAKLRFAALHGVTERTAEKKIEDGVTKVPIINFSVRMEDD
ncbi:MAG: hypothetical protein DRJ03_02535 [Chloroflexi bacterium]|nr:MAG: hypothetical protein DRJ03_02535 [Chloroflexota bacterium]